MKPKSQTLIAALRRANFRAYANAATNYCEAMLRIPRPRTLPVNLDIVLTKACNLRCIFCISYGSLKNERWMDFALYERIARKLFPSAHGLFICSGGEPFLYPRIRDALNLARHYRTMTTVTSNGMLLNREIAQWLVDDQSLHELCISFDGGKKETLERIRRGANFDTILENIAYLSDLKKRNGVIYPRTWFRYVVMNSNAHELPAALSLAAQHGLYKVEVKYLNVSNDIDFSESLYSSPELAREVFAEARRRARDVGVRIELPPLPDQAGRGGRCLNPWQFLQIDTDGSLRFCYPAWRQRLGFFDEDFESIWAGEHYQRIRKTIDSDEPYYPHCLHCSVRLGVNSESSHNQKLEPHTFLIPGLEKWQIEFNRREEENVSSFRELKASSVQKDLPEDAGIAASQKRIIEN